MGIGTSQAAGTGELTVRAERGRRTATSRSLLPAPYFQAPA
jgi:hypothetical protein